MAWGVLVDGLMACYCVITLMVKQPCQHWIPQDISMSDFKVAPFDGRAVA